MVSTYAPSTDLRGGVNRVKMNKMKVKLVRNRTAGYKHINSMFVLRFTLIVINFFLIIQFCVKLSHVRCPCFVQKKRLNNKKKI